MTFKGKNLLIIKYSSLGDIINAMPAVAHLRNCEPGAKIYWLVKKEYAPLLENAPFIDEIVILERNLKLVKRLLTLKIDVVIDFQGLLKSATIGFLSGAKRRVCFSYTREGSALFYTDRLGIDRADCHAVEENLSVVEALVGKKLTGEKEFDLNLCESDISTARELLKVESSSEAPVVVISPTARWASKRYPPERFAELADRLIAERNAVVFFTGMQGDRSYIDDIIGKMESTAVSLAGKTDLKVLAGVLNEAGLVVSCDSGAMHLTSALGTPVVSIFGPTEPSYTGPYAKNAVAISANAECAPCRKRDCDDMRCMKELSVDKVYLAATEFMDRL